MALESGTYVSDLNSANPASGDSQGQGDDHLRLIKSVLTTTFPNANKAFYFPAGESISSAELLVAADLNKVVSVDASGADVVVELPAGLASGDAGWEVTIVKTDSSSNVVSISVDGQTDYINGDSKYINMSGEFEFARCIWTGSEFIALARQMAVPRGTLAVWSMQGHRIDEPTTQTFNKQSVPAGWVLCNGGVLTTSTAYPDLRQWLIDESYPWGQSGSDPKVPGTLTGNAYTPSVFLYDDGTWAYYGAFMIKA